MKKVIIKDQQCLFFESFEAKGISVSDILNYPNIYAVRHAEKDLDRPISIERFAVVNRLGFVCTNKPLMENSENFIRVVHCTEEGGKEIWAISHPSRA